METDKHYLKVGAFVLLTILAAALFSVWLVGAHSDSQYTTYRIRFEESVSGLDVGGPVKFRGVQVGKVDTMSIDPADTRRIRVDVSVLKTTPIKTDTVATLKLQGITGSVYVELSGSNPKAADVALSDPVDKDNPPEIPSTPSSLNAIMDTLPEILKKVSHIADQADKLFSDKNVAAVSGMIGGLQKALRFFLPHQDNQEQEKIAP